MNSRHWIARLAFAGAIGSLALVLSPAGGSASPPSFQPAAYGAVPGFLQQPSDAQWSSQGGGGSSRNHLPTSVMPNGTIGLRCSVDASDLGSPPSCSTTTVAVRCTAHCDNLQFCSAFPATPGTGAVCSALGGTKTTCSVLQPVINSAAQSLCSVFGDATGLVLRCSVMASGWKQSCSAQNGASSPGNQCSTITISGAIGGTLQCSVINGGTALRNYCSVGDPVQPGQVPKQCSTFMPSSRCSVLSPNRGACSVFMPAPAGTCTAFVAGSHCSVINGAAGTFCNIP